MLLIFGHPLDLYFGMVIGFFGTVAIASALDKFGDEMFERGVAQPFFVGKYRLHHRSILLKVVPVAYLAIAGMILMGFVKIQWGLFWTGIAGTILVALGCLVVDMTVDYFSQGRGIGVVRHELVYMAVPLYAFAAFLRFVV